MVQVINKKTVCRVEVVKNNKVLAERSFNIPAYPELRFFEKIVENRKIYLDKKLNEIIYDCNRFMVDYELVVYLMSKG